MRQIWPMVKHSPAFQLLCACCRWPHSQAQLVAIEQASAEGVDWDEFRVLANSHRVCGLVHSALDVCALTPPQAFSDWLAEKVGAVARANLLQLLETIRLQRVYAEAGIDAIAVKGVVLGQHIYGTVALKQNRDIDFVVPPEHVNLALAIARNEGYQLYEPSSELSGGQIAAIARYGKEFALRKNNSVVLEIHSRLTENPALLDERLLDRNGQKIAFGATQSVRTLNDQDLFAYLCVHGAHHNWARLKWLADLNALLARAGDEERVLQLNAHADALGAKWAAIQAQSLCSELLGRPLPEQRKSLAATRRGRQLKDYCVQAMTEPDRGGTLEPLRELRDMLVQTRLGSGLRFWRGFLLWEGVRTSVILELDLPERFIFLYPYIRPFFWVWFRWLSPKGRYRWARKEVDSTN